MKKNLTFLLIGLMLAMPITIFGETVVSIIGKEIQGQFPLFINGVKSEKDAVVVDGVSYIPVRAAGELFGYDVGFIDSEILLVKHSDIKAESIEVTNAISTEIAKVDLEILKWQHYILRDQEKMVKEAEKFGEVFEGSDIQRSMLQAIEDYKAKIAELQAQKAELSPPTEEMQ